MRGAVTAMGKLILLSNRCQCYVSYTSTLTDEENERFVFDFVYQLCYRLLMEVS